jgi:ABC-type lipoprotein release transport system permease subunit
VGGVIVGVAALSGLFPGIRAARLEITEALSYE